MPRKLKDQDINMEEGGKKNLANLHRCWPPLLAPRSVKDLGGLRIRHVTYLKHVCTMDYCSTSFSPPAVSPRCRVFSSSVDRPQSPPCAVHPSLSICTYINVLRGGWSERWLGGGAHVRSVGQQGVLRDPGSQGPGGHGSQDWLLHFYFQVLQPYLHDARTGNVSTYVHTYVHSR